MKKGSFLLLGLLLAVSLSALMVTVKQDGSGDFITINQAIDAVDYGDSILVHPGIYREYICLMDLTVLSLYWLDPNPQYIRETVLTCDSTAQSYVGAELAPGTLIGFTIRGGFGLERAGGVGATCGESWLSHCIIEHNSAGRGGGVYVGDNGILHLAGSTIRYNHAHVSGGGILVDRAGDDVGTIIFSETERNNIYGNTAGRGNDIFLSTICDSTMIYADTLSYAVVTNDFVDTPFSQSIDFWHAKMEPIAHDLYVAPNGNDQQSGLSASEPWQTIAVALARIAACPEAPYTIHLAEGVYSVSGNQQFFPLNLRGHVQLQGAGTNTTILDGENTHSLLLAWGGDEQGKVSDLSLLHGGHDLYRAPVHVNQSELWLERVRLAEHGVEGVSGGNFIYAVDSSSLRLENCLLEGSAEKFGILGRESSHLFMRNCIARGFVTGPGGWLTGCAIQFDEAATLIGVEIYNNDAYDNYYGPQVPGINIANDFNSTLPFSRLINVTVAGNGGRAPIQFVDVEAEMINCIVYDNDNTDCSVRLWDHPEFPNYPSGTPAGASLRMQHCCIEGGASNVRAYGSEAHIQFMGGIWPADPLFEDSEQHIYTLQAESPCRNAGLADTSGLQLPALDLSGNQRICGTAIDLGAYEYQEQTSCAPEAVWLSDECYVTNYPNPFNPETKICFTLMETSPVNLTIYNVKGQKVKTLMDETCRWGSYSVTWNGTNQAEEPVASGLYFFRLLVDGQLKAARKMMLLK